MNRHFLKGQHFLSPDNGMLQNHQYQLRLSLTSRAMRSVTVTMDCRKMMSVTMTMDCITMMPVILTIDCINMMSVTMTSNRPHPLSNNLSQLQTKNMTSLFFSRTKGREE